IENRSKNRQTRVEVACALAAAMLRQPLLNVARLYRPQWQRASAKPSAFQLRAKRTLVFLRRGRQSANRPLIFAQHLSQRSIAKACIGAAKIAAKVCQVAPGQLVIVRAEFFSMQLPTEADSREVLGCWIIAVKTGGFRLRPLSIRRHVREHGVS